VIVSKSAEVVPLGLLVVVLGGLGGSIVAVVRLLCRAARHCI